MPEDLFPSLAYHAGGTTPITADHIDLTLQGEGNAG